MDFSFNPDQKMIAEMASSFLSAESDSAAIRRAMATEQGYENALWQKITQEFGWQLTHIPEDSDGLGLGYVELCVLFEMMGMHLTCAPFFSTVALGLNAIMLAGDDPQKAKYLPKIASGELSATLAYSANGRAWDLEAVDATYQKVEGHYQIDGQYSYVVDGHSCDLIIAAARGAEGIKLFVVAANASGVQRDWTPTVDQTRKLATLQFTSVQVADNAAMQGSAHELENVLALASIALAAEQMGVAQAALDQTINYIQERKQFGRPVGGFQAVKHKAADMLNKTEAARSAVYYAACVADEFFAGNELGSELLEAASIAKAYCCDAAYFNTGTAIQLHGGVGFTWEYDIHLYFKRAKAGQVSFGDSAWHKERIAKLLLEDES